MQTQVVNDTGAEIMYGNFTNASGATITLGYPIAFTTTAASVDGNKAVLPATSNLLTFAGIAEADVADNGVGRYIAYGYAASTYIFAIGSSVTCAVGIALGPNAASLGVNSTGLLDTYGPVVGLEVIGAAINSPGGWARAFVRAM
jgi:hypothetical protein